MFSVGIKEDSRQWSKLEWNPNIEQKLYRDWGTYYSHRLMDNIAVHYYDKALDMEGDDYMTLYSRSQTHRKAARIERALADATKAEAMAKKSRGPNVNISLEICCELFELNQFENSEVSIKDNLRIFKGNDAMAFKSRLVVVDDVIKDVTGRAMSILFSRNQQLIQRIDEIQKAKAIKDDRTLWKRLRDQGKCDVVSIPEIEETILSPLEKARRKRAFNVVHQTYMNDAWYDIYFMKLLRKNPSLLLEQCQRSKGIAQTLSVKQYEIIRQFMKMLQSRNPLYLFNYVKYSNKKMLEKIRESFLFRIQAQTHRNMILDLRQIRKMRKEKRIHQLSNYVEKVMGEYYVKKSNRVMCWKFEFHNEVYNILALSLSDQYYVPKNGCSGPMVLEQLLRLPRVKILDIEHFVFGDRSTYQEGADQDIAGVKFRKIFAHFDQRIRFAKFSIERAYLYHQIAHTHLSQGHYDECCFNARKAIKESRECDSLLWDFLSIILIVKANTLQHKVEQTAEALEMGLPIVQQLKSPGLIKFIEMCIVSNAVDVSRKLSLISSRQSKMSRNSSLNTSSQTSNLDKTD